MAAEIIKEIDTYKSSYHIKIGTIFCFCLIFISFLLSNLKNTDSIPFVANFNYVEGINELSEVQIAGIKVGDINKIMISSERVIIDGYIDRKYDIPEDSIIKIKSKGIFGKKVLSIEPGFGENFDNSELKYIFNQTQDSYSVDMFLRYLNSLND